MPSRNNREKFCDAASRSPNETGCSPSIERSDMSAPHHGKACPCTALVSSGDSKILPRWFAARDRRCRARWQAPAGPVGSTILRGEDKKEPPFSAAPSHDREASNRVDRSHSRPQSGQQCNGRKILMGCKSENVRRLGYLDIRGKSRRAPT